MRFFTWLIAILIILGLIIGASILLIVISQPDVSTSPAQELTFSEEASRPASAFDLVLLEEMPRRRQLIFCQHQLRLCEPQIIPTSVDGDAVFDGDAWYLYRHTDNDALSLARYLPDTNATETIVEETPLARPRGLLLSPDGLKVAYWLDNVSEPAAQLTELWVYDRRRGSTTIVAEKLSRSTIQTEPHWNQSSTHLWFFNKDHNLRVIAADNATPYQTPPSFPATLDPDTTRPNQIDISADGNSIAYVAEQTSTARTAPVSSLTIYTPNQPTQHASITGSINYLLWLPSGRLLYAATDPLGVSFWEYRHPNHRFIVRHPAALRSLRIDTSLQHLLFTSHAPQADFTLYALALATGQLQTVGEFKRDSEYTSLVLARPAAETTSQVAGLTTAASDEELAAFVIKHLPEIVQLPEVAAHRLLMTNQPNTLYVDYRTSELKGRVLLTVRDVAFAEWSVRGWYQALGQDWRRVEGSGLTDPEVTRWYEWEDSLQQWVLKSGG
jgi:hypothetical protein